MAENFQQDDSLRDDRSRFDFSGIVPTQIKSRIRWGAIVVILIILFLLVSFLRSIYTDLLWFDGLGFSSVYIKILSTRIILFIGGALIFSGLSGLSLYCAHKLSDGPMQLPLPQSTVDFLKKLIIWGTIAGIIILSLIFGSLLSSQWEVFLRYGDAVSFAKNDPVFGNDLSFYVFALPLYDFLQGWFLGAAVTVLIATLAFYFVKFSFRGIRFQITSGLRLQASIILAVIMLIVAIGHWLDRWGILLSDAGLVFGATYVDVHARKLALLVLSVIALSGSILILANIYLKGIKTLVGALALWIVASIILGTAWPNAMQRFSVAPQEFAKEEPFISDNIEFTRGGFGLDKVLEQSYPVQSRLSADIIKQNLQTIENIRLWDDAPLADVYRQIQLIRPYYDFKDADVDRYMIDGDYRQVMLAAREVAQEKLNEDAQTWINLKLRYTHGFGMAMSPVTEFTTEGRPEFFAKNIPQDGMISIQSQDSNAKPDIVVHNPRIYYGEKTVEFVIVNSNTPELDYEAEGGELRSNNYSGIGGVKIDSFLNRLAYAWQFADINILLTGEIKDGSRIQYRREIQDRISTVVPFLLLDKDPYLVAAEVDGHGKLYWMQDAYTITDRYPYSDPVGSIDGEEKSTEKSFNYIRNSVKITVDAYDGTLRFYIWDSEDPIIKTYRSMFPGLFLDKGEMPDSLLKHTRYPQDLFHFQAEKYLRYHMHIALDFYNMSDIWSIPNEKFGQDADLQPVNPYYVIMKLPNESHEEFMLLLPYTRNDPPIMAGWLAARNDGPNYGQLVAFNFPKDRQVDSPEQIEAKIDNDPYISQWLTLRCQEGSFCRRGNLLVIPMAFGDAYSILYVEPIYMQAEGVNFPELKQVILATQDNVVMHGSVDEAVEALTGYSRITDVTLSADSENAVIKSDLDLNPLNLELQTVDQVIEQLKNKLSSLEEAVDRLKSLTGGE